jgi:hypothetical protein
MRVSNQEMIMRRVALLLFIVVSACAPAVAPIPTAEPQGTATQSSTSTPIPSPTSTATLTPPPDEPCDNPLVPLVIGSQWKYRVTTDSGEREYTLNVLERVDSGNVLMLVEFADQEKSVQERIVCLDGVIEDFPLFVMDMLFAERLNKFMNTYHDRGTYAPSHAMLAGNNWVMGWEAYYLTEDGARITNPLGPPDLSIVQSSPIDISFNMDGTREPVTVPAGAFPQALRVAHDFTVSATWGNNGGHLTIETTQWYEPYVGLLRAEVDQASYTIGIQESGIPWNSVLELIEFTPGR